MSTSKATSTRSARHHRATPHEINALLQRCIEALPPSSSSSPSPSPSAATIPRPPPRASSTATKSLHIILTGSTSSIGAHFLLHWLRSPHVRRITALDRKPGAADRLAPILALLAPRDRAKVVFLPAAVALPDFGLCAADLSALDDADVFVHNAWPVNYALPLAAYADQLLGIARHLCAWAMMHGTTRPRVVLISSDMCVENWPAVARATADPVPERIVADPRACLGDGYSASKHIAERLLGAASAQCGIPVTILRLGQIAGALDIPPHASADTIARFFTWSRREWFYMYLVSSQHLGLIAGEGQRVDYVPVDRLATIMLEVLRHDTAAAFASASAAASDDEEDDGGNRQLTVYNLTNTPVPWSELVPTMAAHIFDQERSGTIVPLQEWLRALRAINPKDQYYLKAYPILRILPLIEAMAGQHFAQAAGGVGTERRGDGFEKKRLFEASPEARRLRAMDAVTLSHYLKMWGFNGNQRKENARTVNQSHL